MRPVQKQQHDGIDRDVVQARQADGRETHESANADRGRFARPSAPPSGGDDQRLDEQLAHETAAASRRGRARTLISPTRFEGNARSMRLATLAQAISSTRPTAPRNRSSGRRVWADEPVVRRGPRLTLICVFVAGVAALEIARDAGQIVASLRRRHGRASVGAIARR